MDDDSIKSLKNVIRQMARPLRGIPLNLVIEALSSFKIVAFDKADPEDDAVLKKLMSACEIAGKAINQQGILRPRPNEVGNDIEAFVRRALGSVGYKAVSPTTRSGRTKVAGYPDIEFVDEFGRTHYLECKTFNIENIRTTQRSFYLSPSDNFKVIKDARHFVVSFEIYVGGERGSNHIYKCRSWKVLSVEKLLVDVKYEFNSDNLRLYSKDNILAEGEL